MNWRCYKHGVSTREQSRPARGCRSLLAGGGDADTADAQIPGDGVRGGELRESLVMQELVEWIVMPEVAVPERSAMATGSLSMLPRRQEVELQRHHGLDTSRASSSA